MENPFSADKSNPFLTPYPPPGAPATGIKPFAAGDLAPPVAAAARPATPAPQASPLLKPDFSNAFLSRETPASAPQPAHAAPVTGPVPAASLAATFSPPPTSSVTAIAPFAAKTVPPSPADYSPVPERGMPQENPALAAAPAAAPVPPRRGAGTEASARSNLAMTDADAPPARPFTITTGPLEGRRIAAYLGIVSVEIVIPKDILFQNPAPYGELHRIKAAEEQLQRVKRKAFEELTERARSLGADGIVGAALQFSQFDAVVFLCSAVGTAVKIGE